MDYLKLRLAADLAQHEVPTARIRSAVDFLDSHVPNWYLLPAELAPDVRRHVIARVPESDTPFLADEHGQHLLDIQLGDGLSAPSGIIQALVRTIARGPLGELAAFDDAVSMNPRTNLAQPTLRGTALETRFIAAITRDVGINTAASLYDLEPHLIKRAVAFEELVA